MEIIQPAAPPTATPGAMTYKGAIDASGNPNYPSATVGDVYAISVAGKVGGGSGETVEAGDYVIANATNAGGTQASVGASWDVIQANTNPAAWGGITGTLSSQTDLQAALSGKADDADIPTRASLGLATTDTPTFDNLTLTGGKINGVKVYRALLTQVGTDAPVATVSENSLGGAVVWTRAEAGVYIGTLVGAFTPNKTFPLVGTRRPINEGGGDGFVYSFGLERADTDSITLSTARISVTFGSISIVFDDGFLNETSVLIYINP